MARKQESTRNIQTNLQRESEYERNHSHTGSLLIQPGPGVKPDHVAGPVEGLCGHRQPNSLTQFSHYLNEALTPAPLPPLSSQSTMQIALTAADKIQSLYPSVFSESNFHSIA